jgi:P4 family phage/plasmid primase-like protien
MPVISDFMKQIEIPFNYCGVFLNDEGEKVPVGAQHDLSKEQVKNLKNNCFWETTYGKPLPDKKNQYTDKAGKKIFMKSLKDVEKKYSLYLNHCEDLYCVDVDEVAISDIETFGYFKDCLWKQGNTKGLHIYVFIKNVPKYSNQVKIWHDESFDVDLIYKNMWEDDKKPIHNFKEDGDYPIYEWSDIKNLFNETSMNIQASEEKKKKTKFIKPMQEVKSDEEFISDPENVKIALRCLNAISIHRVEAYDTWFKIGCILYKEFRNDGLELFKNVSKRASNYDENGVMTAWTTISNYGKYDVGLGTLIMWARNDYPEFCINEFEDYFKVKIPFDFTKINSIYYKALFEKNDLNIAHLINYLYPNYFISGGGNIYFFNQYGIYKKDDEEFYFGKLIQGLLKHLEFLLFRISDFEEFKEKEGMTDEQKESAKKMKASFIHRMGHLKEYLGSSHHQKNLKNMLKQITIVPKLGEKMDETNKEVIGFENGVFDLTIMKFRKGRPEDFVSMTTGYDYYEETEEKKYRVTEIIASIWDTPEKAEYFMHKMAYSLTGNKTKQEINIHTGIGSNGKSIVFDLTKNALGEYFGTMNPNYFVMNDTQTDKANSELAKTKGKRLIMVSEPSATAKLQGDKLKRISGNEVIVTRELHKSTIEFKPQFFLHILTNDIPELAKIDGGTERRIKIIDYPFVFKKKDEFIEGRPNIKLADENLSIEIESLTMAFFHLLIFYFKRDYVEIQEVKESTKEYMEDNNPFAVWIQENFIITNDEEDKIFLDEITDDFNDETGLNYPNKFISKRLQQMGLSKPTRSTGGKRKFTGIKKKEKENEEIINGFDCDEKTVS